MSWIKRNLFFFIGSIVAVVLMGLAGYFLYSKWDLNNQTLTKLNDDYELLRRLNSQKPHPGNEKIDNIATAKEQQGQLSNFVFSARAWFQPIPAIPDQPKVMDHDFSSELSKTLDRLQKDATNSSVILPANYNFSFEAEKNKVSFAAAGLPALATQLGEVKELCSILFQARINSLDRICRERVSADDSSGPATDYLTEKSVTNDLAVMTPYELTFKCFSPELGAMLAGFASSPRGFIVKTINVEPAPPAAATEQPLIPAVYGTPQPQYVPPTSAENPDMAARLAARYGLGGRGGGRYGPGGPGLGGVGVPYRGPAAPAQTYAPQPTYPQPAATGPKSGGLPTVLDEKQLKVTLNLVVVKLLPPK